MQTPRDAALRGFLLTGLVIVGLLFALIFIPTDQKSSANNDRGRGRTPQLGGHDHESRLENYDIRTDRKAAGEVANIRARRGRTAPEVADARDRFVDGEKRLGAKVRNLRVEYSETLKVPEVIGVDTRKGVGLLTAASQGKRADTLRGFLRANRGLVGLSDSEVAELRTIADYTNPEDSMSFVHLEQTVGGVPVFQGEVKAGFTKKGEIVRVVNKLAPGASTAALAGDDFGDPVNAVRKAFGHLGSEPTRLDTELDAERSSDLKRVFGSGDYATTAEKMYFATEPGVLVPAWRVLVWEDVAAYYVVVDAETGTMLWRKDITSHQTQAATYGVYRNANAMIDVADSPAPLTPGPTSPLLGTQGALLSRTSISRIGNEGNYSFNTNGWITDGGTTTVGNNVRAGLDRDGVNGVDTNGEAVSATRNFVYSYNPFDPNTLTGDAPVPTTTQTYPPTDYQQGAITQMFWITNWWHDEMYRLGFTEQAFNFQFDNFGRGGSGNDRVNAESQDSSGTNNANMSTPADGTSGRMQMYIFTPPNPDVDAALDADIVIHELTHGLSNRLHGNTTGLTTNMARGMGEGWSDFYAHAMLSEPTDSVAGVYTTGGYSTYALRAAYPTGNYYFGIRRFPKAIKSSVGTNGKPHNPLTFQDIDATKIDVSDGAFTPPFSASAADQVHAAGEVWSTALWEVRGRLVQRLGGEAGNRRALQLVTNGMKLSPGAPTFLQARDAIIAAAQASSLADVEDVWRGFATRGMGASAKVDSPGSGSGTARVTEAFDLPGVTQTGTIPLTDPAGDNDGFAEPGETVRMSVTLLNSHWTTATGVTVNVGSGSPVSYGSITSGATATNFINVNVPSSTPCGSALVVTFNVNSSVGESTFTRTLIMGQPSFTFQQNFDGIPAPGFPDGWLATIVSSGTNFVSSTNYADSAPNSAYALNPTAVGGGTDLTSPSIPITASAAMVRFRHRYSTEAGWDGGALEISIADGQFQDIIAAGGRFISGDYNSNLGVGTNNPLNGRNAWSGTSGGFVTSEIQLPAAAAGQSVKFRWRFGADDNTAGTGPNPGWYIDDVGTAGTYVCNYSASGTDAVADFDGDGKTDVGIYRPTGGSGNAEWWYLKSGSPAGTFGALGFGTSTDIPAPADFTGDGKADPAFFRPSTGQWYIVRSEDSSFYAFPFGASGDVPAPADYDGDGKADAAVYRPSNGFWYILRSSNGAVDFVGFGVSGDRPIPADYDGDGRSDIAVFRPTGTTGGAEWWLYRSTAGVIGYGFGSSTDKPVVGDYTGDGKADVAFFRPSNGNWYIIRSNDSTFYAFPFGISTDVPTPGDFDGDGKTDAAVFRSGQWFVLRSSDSAVTATPFGISSDKPVPGIALQ